jgi:hypothetical protein
MRRKDNLMFKQISGKSVVRRSRLSGSMFYLVVGFSVRGVGPAASIARTLFR